MSFRSAPRFRTAVVFVLLVLLVPWSALAQNGGSSTLRGQVTDPSGSYVTTATVVLTTPSGDAITAQTDKSGNYEIKGLAAGKYGLKVIATGFTDFAKDGIDVGAGVTKLDVKLTIQTQEQKVTVTDDAAAALSVDPAANAGAIVIQGKDLDALSDDPDELQSDLQ